MNVSSKVNNTSYSPPNVRVKEKTNSSKNCSLVTNNT